MPFLIFGLGNPGPRYAETRHNAGFWFLDRLAETAGLTFRSQSRLNADTARTSLEGHDCILAKPTTFMNHSGQAVRAVMEVWQG
jgi:PTH1 family peptidyl-tRNA hydrolase